MIGATIPQVGLPYSLTHSSDNLLIADEPWVFPFAERRLSLPKRKKGRLFGEKPSLYHQVT